MQFDRLESDLPSDSGLYVEFFQKAVRITAKEEAAGRPIFEDQDWVKITPPGNGLLTVIRKASRSDKARFNKQWAFYEQNRSDNDSANGTPLSQWPLMTPAMVEGLKAAGFRTVEQLAMASDQQIQSIQMSAGVAPTVLREKAKAYLINARDSAAIQKQAEDFELAKNEIENLKAQLANLQRDTGSRRRA
jgi:3-methyladenine DNA glycosylase Tag